MDNLQKYRRTRLVLITMPLVGSMAFALVSLIGAVFDFTTMQVLALVASSFLGFLGLLAGLITLIAQISRRTMHMPNVIAFGVTYLLALVLYTISCGVFIEQSFENEHAEAQQEYTAPAAVGPIQTKSVRADLT